MYIIWAVIIAVALLIEFLAPDIVAVWFSISAVVAMILVPFDVAVEWQVLTFFVLSVLLLLLARPFAKRFIRTETTPTNADAEIGRKYKLLKPVVEGRSEIQINDIPWTVICEDQLEAGAMVEIFDKVGNRFHVKDVNKVEKASVTNDEVANTKPAAKKNKKSED